MYAVIGRVRIHPGHEDETQAMITDGGIGMVQALAVPRVATGRGASPTAT